MDDALQLSEAQAAYLTGIIDGEGYIGLNRSGAVYWLRVVIKTTSKELADWLVAATGLGRKIQKRDDKRGNRQPAYEWRVFGDQARWVLEAICRYLVVKTEQARLAIEYQSLPRQGKAARGLEFCNGLKRRNLKETWQRTVGQSATATISGQPCLPRVGSGSIDT